ncbi:hypothetical protein FIM07_03920 [SAR202 cluster bacterium AD-802-F09_MRT_200m]|nr:hypothetical protein [SAR202 cluster bacterium AD-802-F09_MRT_200m]
MSYRNYSDIHQILEPLKDYRSFEDAEPDLPENGIYFYYTKGERFKTLLDDNRRSSPRITRVGIATADGNLPERIKTHYRAYGSSIFRDHIERALKKRYKIRLDTQPKRRSADWWQGEITKYLEQNCWFKVVETGSADEANSWETSLLATLAPYSYQFCSSSWLGRWWKGTKSDRISEYGMWNIQKILQFDEEFDDSRLSSFNDLIRNQ